MKAYSREYWNAITALMLAAVLFGEFYFLDTLTYSAWWRWFLGLEPKHWRRFFLVPAFVLLWAVFVPHIVLKWLWIQSNK